jgi:hypothetical protein
MPVIIIALIFRKREEEEFLSWDITRQSLKAVSVGHRRIARRLDWKGRYQSSIEIQGDKNDKGK